MGNIYFISDLHFCHNRDFVYGPRGYHSIYEHDEAIIEAWNKTVAYDDTVYILGDIMLNDNKTGINNLRRLNGCKKIILGNHDTEERVGLYTETYNVEVLGYADIIKLNGFRFYLSHYPTLTSNKDVDKPLKSKVINLCGHTHTQNRWADFDKGLIYHVEWDAHGKPKLVDEIIEELKERLAQ